jgi:outer membrane protein assembly factor BamB
VYASAEIGDDLSYRGRPRPARLARGLLLALVVGVLAGMAIMLQVDAWHALAGESGGACGTSDQGISYGACPRGITPALILSFVIGLPALCVALVLLFRRGWARRGVLAVAVAAGLFAGQSLWGTWHGTDLSTAWAAPYDTAADLTTVGVWTTGDSLIRIRVDEVASYAAATGRQQWTLPVPGTDVACSVSASPKAGPGATTGLVAYGTGPGTCDHVMAVDLATGRQLWSARVSDPYAAGDATGALAVAGPAAVILTTDGIAGVDASTGARKWTLAPPRGCVFQQLAGSGSSTSTAGVVALAACDSSYYVTDIDPATGKQAWRAHVSEPSASYQFQVLSVDPVVVSDDIPGPRGTSVARVFSAGGRPAATFSVAGIIVAGAPTALNTASNHGFGVPAMVTDGLLIGVTTETSAGRSAIVAYRLASGQRQWLVDTPDAVYDVALHGSEVSLVDASDPALSLEEVSVATGTLRSLGYFSDKDVESSDSGLYVVDGDYLVVNLSGVTPTPPVAAVMTPAMTKG